MHKFFKINKVIHIMIMIMFKILIKNVIYFLDLCLIITYNMVDVLFYGSSLPDLKQNLFNRKIFEYRRCSEYEDDLSAKKETEIKGSWF